MPRVFYFTPYLCRFTCIFFPESATVCGIQTGIFRIHLYEMQMFMHCSSIHTYWRYF